MKNVLTIIVLLTLNSQLFAQDMQIQEPIKNFDQLWNQFNDRYAFFEHKNVDWNTIYKKYRPLLDERTTNDSLFNVCNEMLLELKDGHVGLVQFDGNKVIRESNDGHQNILIKKFPITKDSEPNIFQLVDLTNLTLQKNGFSNLIKSESKLLQISESKDYGYLVIAAMEDFKSNEINSFMTKAIDLFKNKKGVIIDLRTNQGGYDSNSRNILGYFTDKKRIGYLKKTRKKGTNSYSKLKTKYIKPKGNQQFTKPVVLLTSDLTASAADVFTLMSKELPHVTIIGGNTQGIFSDVYEFKLPNGWKGRLSHQQYFSADMQNYEGIGVEPHIKLLNEKEDIINGFDPLIVKAIEVLSEKNKR
ncbi:S41 family peptidase [Aquimarina muelleri]|uniref:S41 family peptidase n=1 Tax=Aquimarina muelleri TaxID=279356 RepID=UPI003F686945